MYISVVLMLDSMAWRGGTIIRIGMGVYREELLAVALWGVGLF